MPLILDGTTGIVANNIAANTITSTQIASGSKMAFGNMPTGSVIQVVNGFTSTGVTTSATETWVDTGITATITPKFASSNIMVLVNIVGIKKEGSSHWNRMGFQILRNSTAINSGLAQNWSYNTAFYFRAPGAMYSKLDSPSTTSAITYKVQFKVEILSDAAGISVQTDSNSGESQIMLMEIAA